MPYPSIYRIPISQVPSHSVSPAIPNGKLNDPAGETVALVGSSSVGETTLRSLRQNVGVVQQDVYLFDGTIYDNIRYGKPDASVEAIAAAKKPMRPSSSFRC